MMIIAGVISLIVIISRYSRGNTNDLMLKENDIYMSVAEEAEMFKDMRVECTKLPYIKVNGVSWSKLESTEYIKKGMSKPIEVDRDCNKIEMHILNTCVDEKDKKEYTHKAVCEAIRDLEVNEHRKTGGKLNSQLLDEWGIEKYEVHVVEYAGSDKYGYVEVNKYVYIIQREDSREIQWDNIDEDKVIELTECLEGNKGLKLSEYGYEQKNYSWKEKDEDKE